MADWSYVDLVMLCFFSKMGAQFLKRSSAKRSAWEDTGRGGKGRDGKVREREGKGR